MDWLVINHLACKWLWLLISIYYNIKIIHCWQSWISIITYNYCNFIISYISYIRRYNKCFCATCVWNKTTDRFQISINCYLITSIRIHCRRKNIKRCYTDNTCLIQETFRKYRRVIMNNFDIKLRRSNFCIILPYLSS